jgi:hypothetical protein
MKPHRTTLKMVFWTQFVHLLLYLTHPDEFGWIGKAGQEFQDIPVERVSRGKGIQLSNQHDLILDSFFDLADKIWICHIPLISALQVCTSELCTGIFQLSLVDKLSTSSPVDNQTRTAADIYRHRVPKLKIKWIKQRHKNVHLSIGVEWIRARRPAT